MKATHRGNCQVCGHQQHAMAQGVAKHGYTVTFGYFNGTCAGSDRKPIQQERTLTDATIGALQTYARSCDEMEMAMRAGVKHPAKVTVGREYNTETHRYDDVKIAWGNATAGQREHALKLAIAQEESNARGARSHAVALSRMADELHGTPLVSISDMERALMDEAAARAANKAKVDLKAGKVTGAFGSKADRKAELDKINRLFEAQTGKLQALYLAIPNDARTDAQRGVYYTPMYPHQWKAKHSAAALKEFPQAAAIVAEIEKLVAAREAVKAAP